MNPQILSGIHNYFGLELTVESWQTIVAGGWVKTGRTAEKDSFAFLELNDGSCVANLQASTITSLTFENAEFSSDVDLRGCRCSSKKKWLIRTLVDKRYECRRWLFVLSLTLLSTCLSSFVIVNAFLVLVGPHLLPLPIILPSRRSNTPSRVPCNCLNLLLSTRHASDAGRVHPPRCHLTPASQGTCVVVEGELKQAPAEAKQVSFATRFA